MSPRPPGHVAHARSPLSHHVLHDLLVLLDLRVRLKLHLHLELCLLVPVQHGPGLLDGQPRQSGVRLPLPKRELQPQLGNRDVLKPATRFSTSSASVRWCSPPLGRGGPGRLRGSSSWPALFNLGGGGPAAACLGGERPSWGLGPEPSPPPHPFQALSPSLICWLSWGSRGLLLLRLPARAVLGHLRPGLLPKGREGTRHSLYEPGREGSSSGQTFKPKTSDEGLNLKVLSSFCYTCPCTARTRAGLGLRVHGICPEFLASRLISSRVSQQFFASRTFAAILCTTASCLGVGVGSKDYLLPVLCWVSRDVGNFGNAKKSRNFAEIFSSVPPRSPKIPYPISKSADWIFRSATGLVEQNTLEVATRRHVLPSHETNAMKSSSRGAPGGPSAPR